MINRAYLDPKIHSAAAGPICQEYAVDAQVKNLLGSEAVSQSVRVSDSWLHEHTVLMDSSRDSTAWLACPMNRFGRKMELSAPPARFCRVRISKTAARFMRTQAPSDALRGRATHGPHQDERRAVQKTVYTVSNGQVNGCGAGS